MSFEGDTAKYFGLKTPEDWLKHANPWSVLTRSVTLPLLILAIWSRVWIGGYSLIFIILLIVWSLLNPTLFPKYTRINTWWSKCVIGEYFWTKRGEMSIPKHHYGIIKILTMVQIIGGIILVIGLYKVDVFLTIIGTIIVYLGKMWFLDRMVWIYEDMKNDNEDFKMLEGH